MNFLDQPLSFTRTKRTSESNADRACAVQKFKRGKSGNHATDFIIAAIFVLSVALLAAGVFG